jgi:hypothetical protein
VGWVARGDTRAKRRGPFATCPEPIENRPYNAPALHPQIVYAAWRIYKYG